MEQQYKELSNDLHNYFRDSEDDGKFAQYLPEFLYSANKFAIATGQISEDMSDKSLLTALANQALVVLEEIEEFLGAEKVNDINEMYDAIIDTFYTLSNYDLLTTMYAHRQLEDEQAFLNHKKIKRKLSLMLGKIIDVEQGGVTIFSDTHLYQSARLIEENNNMKYTDNMVEFLNWEIDDTDGLNTMRVMNLVQLGDEDKIFFCLKDQNGKVRKHKHFQKVDLSFVNKT